MVSSFMTEKTAGPMGEKYDLKRDAERTHHSSALIPQFNDEFGGTRVIS